MVVIHLKILQAWVWSGRRKPCPSRYVADNVGWTRIYASYEVGDKNKMDLQGASVKSTSCI